jgi:hypothetical protein
MLAPIDLGKDSHKSLQLEKVEFRVLPSAQLPFTYTARSN